MDKNTKKKKKKKQTNKKQTRKLKLGIKFSASPDGVPGLLSQKEEDNDNEKFKLEIEDIKEITKQKISPKNVSTNQ